MKILTTRVSRIIQVEAKYNSVPYFSPKTTINHFREVTFTTVKKQESVSVDPCRSISLHFAKPKLQKSLETPKIKK